MKVPFCNSWRRTWLAKKQIRWCVVSLICLLCGTYLVGRHFSFLTFLILAFAIILTGRAAGARPNRNGVEKTSSAVWKENAPQITLTWDYRPKKTNRRDTPFWCEEEETAGIAGSGSSPPNHTGDVWFNFTNPEPTPEDPPSFAPLSGDVRKVSA